MLRFRLTGPALRRGVVVATSVLIASAVAAGSAPVSSAKELSFGNSGTLVASNCAPTAAASDGTMVWNEMTAAGTFDAYIGNDDCQGSELLPNYAGNRGATDITTNGQYVLLVTAVGWEKTLFASQPGVGSDDAIQLYNRTTGTTSTLLPGETSSQLGVIWPEFNANDTEIVWSQITATPTEAAPLGTWQIHVADVDLATGTLSDNRVWQEPGVSDGFYEAYGWVPNTNNLIFMSDVDSTATGVNSFQLFTLPDSLSGSATRISPPIDAYWPWETTGDTYHEFAHFVPGQPDTLYTSIGVAALGADLWAYNMDSAGSNGELAQPTRVSYFGGDFDAIGGQQAVAGFPAPAFSLVTSMAWVNGSWVAAVCSDVHCQHVNAYRLTLPASAAAPSVAGTAKKVSANVVARHVKAREGTGKAA